MNNDKFLQNLEDACLDSNFMLYKNKKNTFRNYFMTIKTNSLYYMVTGEEIFDYVDFINNYPDVYKEICYYDLFYSDKRMKNIFTFKDMIFNYGKIVNNILTVPVNKWNSENRLCCKNLDKEDVYDLVNYFIEEKGLDNNLINKFIVNDRIGMFKINDGFFIPDLIDDNDFILLSLNKLDYYQVASTLAHEAGHSDDYNNMTKKERELYSYLSPYKEVKAESMQNSFNNFLIDDKICTSIGNYLNKCQLYKMYCYFNDAMNLFNKDIKSQELIDSVSYSIGLLTSYYLNHYKEKENVFDEIHKKCYDADLLSGIGVNENRVSKVLKKEVNNIR